MLYNLRGKVSDASGVLVLVTDETLTMSGASADAKATGDAIKKAKDEAKAYSDAHIESAQNPHGVTKSQVGLGNVNNTSDMNKPVSRAQAEAIADAKKAGTDAQETADTALIIAEAAKTTADLAASKSYVDSMRFFAEVVLPASYWSASAPYKQTVSLTGIMGSDNPHYGVVYSGDLQVDIARKGAFAKVDALDTYDGYMVFTCFEEKPEYDIPVQLDVQRLGNESGQATALKLTRGLNSDVQAEIEETNYGAENATLNSEPTATTFDFTVL